MIRTPYAPAVIVHAFFHAGATFTVGSPARAAIEWFWAQAAAKGFVDSTGTRNGALQLPHNNRRPEQLAVLGQVDRTNAGRVEELVIFQHDDVVGVSIVDAVSEGRQMWGAFDLSWLHGWTPPQDGFIGAILIHHGLARSFASDRALRTFVDQLPGQRDRNQPVCFWRPSGTCQGIEANGS